MIEQNHFEERAARLSAALNCFAAWGDGFVERKLFARWVGYVQAVQEERSLRPALAARCVQPFETSCAGFAGRGRGCGGGPSEIRRAASVSERAAGDHTTAGAGASDPHAWDCLRPFFLAECPS